MSSRLAVLPRAPRVPSAGGAPLIKGWETLQHRYKPSRLCCALAHACNGATAGSDLRGRGACAEPRFCHSCILNAMHRNILHGQGPLATHAVHRNSCPDIICFPSCASCSSMRSPLRARRGRSGWAAVTANGCCVTGRPRDSLGASPLWSCQPCKPQGGARPPHSPPVHHASCSPCCCCSAAAACLRARRSAPSALHTRRCPARQSACEQAVPQYHKARQALQAGGTAAHLAERTALRSCSSHRHCIPEHSSLPPPHLQRMLPTPCPAAGPPSPATLAQRR